MLDSLGFNVPLTAKVKWRRDCCMKSKQKDQRIQGLNMQPLSYKSGGLTTMPCMNA